MKRQVVLPNVLTALNLSCGLFVIFKMNMMYPGTAGFEQVQASIKILLFAALFDLLDGALARAIDGKSEFGGFFDSMADGISFGVAPSVIVLKTLSAVPGTLMSAFLTISAMMYSVSGIVRLVRYSATSSDQEEKAFFTGLPITCAAIASVAPTLLLLSDEMGSFLSLSDVTRGTVASSTFVILGYLMVSRWKFPSVKRLNVQVSSLQLLVLVASVFSAILLLILHYFSIFLCFSSWGYIVVAWSIACLQLFRGQRRAAIDEDEEE